MFDFSNKKYQSVLVALDLLFREEAENAEVSFTLGDDIYSIIKNQGEAQPLPLRGTPVRSGASARSASQS